MSPTARLDELYREVILDHYRHPHGSSPIAAPTVEMESSNPLCGDELLMQLEIEDDRIARLHIDPRGCSISVASASMLAQQLEGGSVADALELEKTFRDVMRGGEWPEDLDFGDLEALEGVKKFPVRIKCALLAWMTLEQALARVAPELVGEVETDEDIEIRPHESPAGDGEPVGREATAEPGDHEERD